LRQREQRRAVEGEGVLEVDLLQREQTVALGIERTAIGLADHAADREHGHVPRRRGLVGGERRHGRA